MTVDCLHVLYGGMGGQLAVATELARGFRRRGLRSGACLYAPPGSFVGDEAVAPFDEVRRVEKLRRVDVAGARSIGRAVADLAPRAVVWHSAYAPVQLARARLLGRTRVVLLVEHQSLALRGAAYEARSLAALPVASAVVFLSEEYRTGYELRRLPLPALRRARTVPNGVDVDLYRPRASAGATPVPRPRAPRVGMAGRMIASKGFADLLRAAARARDAGGPPCRIAFAGDGPDRPALEELVSVLGLDEAVEFRGQLTGDAFVEFLQGLDVYAHVTRGETSSTALLQAYACGLPVIASDVPGVRTFVRDGVDGVLVPDGREDELARALSDLLADRRRQAALGAAARTRAVTELRSGLVTDGYLQVLSHLDPGGPWPSAVSASDEKTALRSEPGSDRPVV